MRPLTFWTLVAAVLFATMTVFWAVADDPSGAVALLAGVAWWGSGLVLIVAGLIGLARWKRPGVGGDGAAGRGPDARVSRRTRDA